MASHEAVRKKIERSGFAWAMSGEDYAHLFSNENKDEPKDKQAQNSNTRASDVETLKGSEKVDVSTQTCTVIKTENKQTDTEDDYDIRPSTLLGPYSVVCMECQRTYIQPWQDPFILTQDLQETGEECEPESLSVIESSQGPVKNRFTNKTNQC